MSCFRALLLNVDYTVAKFQVHLRSAEISVPYVFFGFFLNAYYIIITELLVAVKIRFTTCI